MLVMVRYVDEEYGLVEDYCLDYLIVTGKITEFARSDEWVAVERDLVRGKGGSYNGPERRKQHDIPPNLAGEA